MFILYIYLLFFIAPTPHYVRTEKHNINTYVWLLCSGRCDADGDDFRNVYYIKTTQSFWFGKPFYKVVRSFSVALYRVAFLWIRRWEIIKVEWMNSRHDLQQKDVTFNSDGEDGFRITSILNSSAQLLCIGLFSSSSTVDYIIIFQSSWLL